MPLPVTSKPKTRRRVIQALEVLRLRDTARFVRSGILLVQRGGFSAERTAVRTIRVPSVLPSARLVYLVTGRVSRLNYHESGQRAKDHLLKILTDVQKMPEAGVRILDFGCGCGRILRWWADSRADMYGCDYNPDLVAWCEANLPFAALRVNGLEPPTSYDDGHFDVIYAHSVLTHLIPPVQESWMREWARLLRPGGILIATTLGPATCYEPGEKERLEADGVIVKSAQLNGENLCSVFNSEADVRTRLAVAADLKVILCRSNDMPDSGQDVWVFQKS
jgi:2-polyprenyl-3-methyl-5-hydroxy-6-metoxy-1,4-benzoquinol methylase